MKYTRIFLLLGLLISLSIFSCKKSDSPGPGGSYQLSYGDSVFYIKNGSADYLVNPVNPKSGRFSSFPEGLEIDPATGVINVTKSEAGMKYRVSFSGNSGESSTTYVVISGINFPDRYYRMESLDTIAFPVYNADPAKALPSGSFDEDRIANNSGCAMRTNNGQINLAESIRNGLFGKNPKNDTRKDFEVKYSLDDQSGKALNKIRILLYYYDRMSDVPEDLRQTVQDHLAMTYQPNDLPLSSAPVSASAKPRPPCIVIIGHNN